MKNTKVSTKKPTKKSGKKGMNLHLGEKDSAIVIFNDGGFEAFFPKQNETDAAFPSTAVASMVMIALSDKVAWDFVFERFNGIIAGKIVPVPLHPKKEG